MKKEIITIPSHDKILTLSLLIQKPTIKPLGLVLIIHGMAEHKERYEPFLNTLAKNGYITAIYDQRGHGESIVSKDDLGYFYEKSGSSFILDLFQIIESLKKHYPNLPIYLFAHSMGTLIARNFIQKYDDQIDGLILSGAPHYQKKAKLGLFLSKILQTFHSEHYRSSFLHHLTFSHYNNQFEGKSENRWICSNLETVKNYDEDPLCGFVFTLNGFENLYNLLINCYDKTKYLIKNPQLPILFLRGSKDPVVGKEKDQSYTCSFLKQLGYNELKEKDYPGKQHELLNELNHEEIEQDILNWLSKQKTSS